MAAAEIKCKLGRREEISSIDELPDETRHTPCCHEAIVHQENLNLNYYLQRLKKHHIINRCFKTGRFAMLFIVNGRYL
jgi:hypothetical protein